MSARPHKKPETSGRVLTLMTEIALEKGLDALSMRDVAKRVGISLAALQYHYPSKDVLVAAFVDATLQAYRKNVEAIRRACEPERQLRELVLYAIDQTLDPQTGDVFAMLDARSRHDPATAEQLDHFMRLYLEAMQDALQRRHPALSPPDARLAAAHLVATIEGLAAIQSAATAIGVGQEELSDAIVAMAETLTFTPRHPGQAGQNGPS